MFRRFKKRFEYQDDKLGKVAIPRNWSGEVSDEVAKAADAAGTTLAENAETAEKTKATDGGPKLDEMTKEQLIALAKERNVAIANDATKPDILAALKAAA